MEDTEVEENRAWYSEHAVPLVGVAVALVGLIALALFSTSKREYGTVLTCAAGAFAVGSLLGFLIGGPGADGDDTGTKSANKAGWSSRIGVFGTWLTGAAFALAIANWSEISDWFANVTRTAAERPGGTVRGSTQYAFGAAMVTAACGGFIFGFMQMATAGRRLFASVEAEVRKLQKQAAETLEQVAEATTELTQVSERAAAAKLEAEQAARRDDRDPGNEQTDSSS